MSLSLSVYYSLAHYATPQLITHTRILANSDNSVYISAAVFNTVVVLAYFARGWWLRRWPEEDVLFGEPPRKGEKQAKLTGDGAALAEPLADETDPLLDTSAANAINADPDDALEPNQRTTPTYMPGSMQTFSFNEMKPATIKP